MHTVRAHTHTHTLHVLSMSHAYICHFQELSVDEDVNVQEFIWTLQKISFSVNVFYIFVCVSKAEIAIQGLPPAGQKYNII